MMGMAGAVAYPLIAQESGSPYSLLNGMLMTEFLQT